MISSIFTLGFALNIGLALGTPLNIRSSYAVKDSFHVPRKWERIGDAPPDHTIRLNIGLKQSNFDELERHLYEGTST